jgi:hypothetical protein
MTTDTIIRDFQHERAELITLLSDARALLAGAKGVLQYADEAPRDEHGFSTVVVGETWKENLADINKFLDAGLFGDKGGK